MDFDSTVTNGQVDWPAIKTEILAGLSIEAEYEALGVRFIGEPGGNARGSRECHAVGRPDNSPSACVFLESGVYHDSGGEGVSLSLFDFALKHGELGRWIDVIRHYAAKAGVNIDGAPQPGKGGRVREAIYPYHDREGSVRYAVFRYKLPNGKKFFSQHPPNGRGGWMYGAGCMDGVEPLPYRLPQLLASADMDDPIFIVEGEKDANRLASLGLTATTNSQGAGSTDKTWPFFKDEFKNRTCILLPHNDSIGRAHMAKVAGYIAPVARSVKVVLLPGLPENGDVSDWLDMQNDPDDLGKLAFAAPEWIPGTKLPAPRAETNGQAVAASNNGTASNGTASNNGTVRVASATKDLASLSNEALGLEFLHEVKLRGVEWIWKHRLAKGSMALMAGDGGIGKSQVMLAIASMITRGSPWPDGSGNAPIGQVVIVSAEDRVDDTVKPRLVALGADLSQVGFCHARITIPGKDGNPPFIDFASLKDHGYWNAVLDRLPDCRLLIVDPVPSYLGRGVNDHKNSEIRQVLEPFIDQVLIPREICMLANTHLNKATDAKTPVHRIIGSVAYANLARNVHIVIRAPVEEDEEDTGRRFFKQAKCNNAPDNLGAMPFRIEPHSIPGDGGEDIETSLIVFEDKMVQVDLADAMAGPVSKTSKKGPDPKQSMAIAAWLVDFLEGKGAMRVGVILDAGGEKYFGEKTGGRWSNGNRAYRARDVVPNLDGERAGFRVDERTIDGRPFWELARDDGPKVDF